MFGLYFHERYNPHKHEDRVKYYSAEETRYGPIVVKNMAELVEVVYSKDEYNKLRDITVYEHIPEGFWEVYKHIGSPRITMCFGDEQEIYENSPDYANFQSCTSRSECKKIVFRTHCDKLPEACNYTKIIFDTFHEKRKSPDTVMDSIKKVLDMSFGIVSLSIPYNILKEFSDNFRDHPSISGLVELTVSVDYDCDLDLSPIWVKLNHLKIRGSFSHRVGEQSISILTAPNVPIRKISVSCGYASRVDLSVRDFMLARSLIHNNVKSARNIF